MVKKRACKITIEKINKVFDNRTNRFRDPTEFEDKYRVVKSTKRGFKVVSTHHNEKAALGKAKKIKC